MRFFSLSAFYPNYTIAMVLMTIRNEQREKYIMRVHSKYMLAIWILKYDKMLSLWVHAGMKIAAIAEKWVIALTR